MQQAWSPCAQVLGRSDESHILWVDVSCSSFHARPAQYDPWAPRPASIFSSEALSRDVRSLLSGAELQLNLTLGHALNPTHLLQPRLINTLGCKCSSYNESASFWGESLVGRCQQQDSLHTFLNRTGRSTSTLEEGAGALSCNYLVTMSLFCLYPVGSSKYRI